MKQKMMWFALSNVQGFNVHYLDRILEGIGDVDAIFRMKKQELYKYLKNVRIPDRMIESLLHVREIDYYKEYENLTQNGVSFITKEEAGFPKRLLQISGAPYYLYYRGKLPSDDVPAIAMIGARNCSVYGQQISLCFSNRH